MQAAQGVFSEAAETAKRQALARALIEEAPSPAEAAVLRARAAAALEMRRLKKEAKDKHKLAVAQAEAVAAERRHAARKPDYFDKHGHPVFVIRGNQREEEAD